MKFTAARIRWLNGWPHCARTFAIGNRRFRGLCRDYRIAALEIAAPDGTTHAVCSMAPGPADVYTARAKMGFGTGAGELLVTLRPATDLQKTQYEIDRYMTEYGQLAAQKRNIRTLYLLFILAIALFILFVATWIALLLARQISSPISALLAAAGEVRRGNLSHRVKIRAIDELATLVRAFNEMMQELEANSRELESRRRFTEAILESIPTGVISLNSDGRIQRVNRALHGLFPAEQVLQATHLRDLFPPEDTSEIEYLMKRARRTGVAASQIDIPLLRVRCCTWRSPFPRCRHSRRTVLASSSCWTIPANCCARRRPPRGTKSPAASRTNSRIL